jgi:hypothetical protein
VIPAGRKPTIVLVHRRLRRRVELERCRGTAPEERLAAVGNDNVKALVHINAIMPDAGESFSSLSAKFAPAPLTKALKQVPFRNGDGTTGTDVYVQPNRLRHVFAADLATSQTDILGAIQRPIALSAFADKLTGAAWRNKPVYVLVGEQDQAINPSLERYEAKRANARKIVEIDLTRTPRLPPAGGQEPDRRRRRELHVEVGRPETGRPCSD